jgi:phosphoglucosamine mutase
MPRVEFGADGIRGIVGEWPFLSPVVVRIGQALGRYISERSEHPFVVIGRDTRSSGQDLLSCLRAGLGDQGVDVINLGVMTTPGVASITRQQKANLGVIVSASHSPHQYNGIKLVNQNGLRLQREEEIEIEFLIDECVNRAVDLSITPGHQTDGQHLIELYIQDHVKRCPVQSLEGLKVVLDCACGAASRVAPEAFRRLGADVVAINDVIEGKDINYECGSEYVRVSPRNLVDVMRQYDASYGFAFDGDGDRLVVVDSNEQVFDGHDLLFVLAVYFHSKGLLRGDTVVAIHRANRGLTEALGRAGIQTVHTDNGDKNVEAAMWGGDFLLGGEPGGNIIINDGHHTAADAVYAALVLGGALIQNRDISLREMAAPLRKRPQVMVSFEVTNKLTLEQRETLQKQVGDAQAELGEDSRILFWESSTEPGVFRVMVEGSCESTLEEVSRTADAVRQLIRQTAGPIFPPH